MNWREKVRLINIARMLAHTQSPVTFQDSEFFAEGGGKGHFNRNKIFLNLLATNLKEKGLHYLGLGD